MKKYIYLFVSVLLVLGQVVLLPQTGRASETPRMTKEQLKTMLDHPDILVVDVRTTPDWDDSESMIKGAVRKDPRKIQIWIKQYPKNKIIVFYCA
jgi:rhodanese-related sulfurtransferase